MASYISIFITKKCNMNCSYCYVKNQFSHTEEDFTIDEIFQNTDKELSSLINEEVTVELMGGEPLANIDRVAKVCEYINKKYKDIYIKFVINTNGTYYSKDIIDIIRKYHISLTVSIDGDKFFHNANRKFMNGNDSWDIVYKNALCFIKEIPEYTKASMTITKLNVEYLLHNILFLYKMGFKRINFTYNNSDINADYITKYTKQILLYYEKYDFKDLKLLSIKKNTTKTRTVYDDDGSIILEVKEEKNSYEGIKFINAWLSKLLEEKLK